MATGTQHRTISDTFLDHAQDEFDKGNMLQASEKTWGAVAHYVKAIARERRWRSTSHVDVLAIAAGLVAATPARSRRALDRRMRAVNGLHRNFYESEFSPAWVQGGIDDAKVLLYDLCYVNEEA